MSRKSLQTKTMSDNELLQAVSTYEAWKKEESNVKKNVKELGDTIKQEMQNRNITEFIANGIRATITITANQDVNELQAIEILRKELSPEQFNKVVKTREYIDDDEFEKLVNQTIYVTATPREHEIKRSTQVVEQLIRPTGLLDPIVEVRPSEGQMEDIYTEVQKRIADIGYEIVTDIGHPNKK